MDAIDEMILDILQRNARVSNKYIAEEVHLSSPAVTARINKLESIGIIEGYSTIINAKKMDKNIMARINLIQLRGTKEQIVGVLNSNPNVINYEHITGRYTLSVKVLVSHTTELEETIDVLRKYGTTETLIILSTTRVGKSTYMFD
ncbi:MAG: Lrp/AsnC family transcriptional regulator [Clostridia bacterium]|nr:Lrp/AsnC family transcriptional regulator [Clostridia bacterium]